MNQRDRDAAWMDHMKPRLISPRRRLNRLALALSLPLLTWACGRDHQRPLTLVSPSTTPSPSPTPTPAPPTISTIHLTGVATDDDGGPVAGATVTVEPYVSNRNVPSVSGVTDGRGFYHIDFDADYLNVPRALLASLIATSPGHDGFWTVVAAPPSGDPNVSQNLRLYRIKRITAGESTVVTVAPGDTSCGPDGFFVCRTVHVVVPIDGLLIMEVGPNPSTDHTLPPTGLALVVDNETDGQPSSATLRVTAGTEEVVDIGMLWTSTVSQSGVYKTSLRRP